MSRVTVWYDGEQITADTSELWEAVDRVGDPFDNFEEFREVLEPE